MIETIQNIIIKLKTDTAISAILGNRMYVGQPIEEVEETYMTVNIISQSQNIAVNNRTRIEFRFIGDSLLTLSSIESLVTRYLVKNCLSMGFYNIEVSSYVHGLDDKKKQVIIRDIVIYQVTNYNV